MHGMCTASSILAAQVFPNCSPSSDEIGGSMGGASQPIHGIACQYNFVRVVVGKAPPPWHDNGPPPLAISVGSETSTQNLYEYGKHVKKEDTGYFNELWRPVYNGSIYADFLVQIPTGPFSSNTSANFAMRVGNGGQKFLYGVGKLLVPTFALTTLTHTFTHSLTFYYLACLCACVPLVAHFGYFAYSAYSAFSTYLCVYSLLTTYNPNTCHPPPTLTTSTTLVAGSMTGRWLDVNTKEKLSATASTPTRIPCTMTASGCASGSRFDKDHKDIVNGTMSADRKTITWDNTHLIGFGVWIKCTGQEARCTGAIRYTDNTKIVVKEGYKRWPYVNKGYHFLVPTNRLYDVKFESKNPSVAPLDLATIEFTVGEMAEGEWLGWRSKPQYCHGDETMPCVPEQYKGFDMHVALEGAMLGSSPLPYRKLNPFSPRHYSSLAPYVWERWDSSLKSQVAAATLESKPKLTPPHPIYPPPPTTTTLTP